MRLTSNPPNIVALMGSHRRGGAIDTALGTLLGRAAQRGASVAKIDLLDRHVEFCTNCRTCCQDPGPERGTCVLDDDVDGILRELESADAIVLAASVNFGDVNARTRQLLERMAGYAYWPWGRPQPEPRSKHVDKPAVLVTSSAAPALLTRLFADPLHTLRRMAKLLHAKPVDSVVLGLAGGPEFTPSERTSRRIDRAVSRLLAGCRTRGAAVNA